MAEDKQFAGISAPEEIHDIAVDQGEKEKYDQRLARAGVHTVGIAGLGLIGGSFAKAYAQCSDAKVLGYDLNDSITRFAGLDGTLDDVLTEENIGKCDLIIPALYPDTVIDYIRKMAPFIRKGALVVDTAGLKRKICETCEKIAAEYGFIFVGGHPMAGKKYSGYKYSTSALFRNASMIVTPPADRIGDIHFLDRLKDVFSPCRFARLTVCTPEKHDTVIAFTSELCHLISNAYIKSPTAPCHKGFSAGSYRDMTRVSWLNENMWTDIFLENRDNLIPELDHMIQCLSEYKEAMENNDAEELRRLLRDGKIAKETIDGKQ